MAKYQTKSTLAAESYVQSIFAKDIHAKRVQSLTDGVTGVLTAGALGIHSIGRGLAAAKGLLERHAIKQVDRLIENKKLIMDDLLELWVPYLLSNRKKIVVNLDWTEFDGDDHSMLVFSLQTWKSALIYHYSKKQWDPRSGDTKYRRSLSAVNGGSYGVLHEWDDILIYFESRHQVGNI